MKTRIISGAGIVLVSVAVLTLQVFFPIFLQISFAVLGVLAVKEALYNTGIVKSKAIVGVGAILAAVVPFVFAEYIKIPLSAVYTIFAVVQFALYLRTHKSEQLQGIFGAILLPIVISFGFSSFCAVAQVPNTKLFYIILALCWSYIADTGAYFSGYFFGKHKMSPIISPKKTWEGLIGSIIISLAFVFGVWAIYKYAFDINAKLWLALLITPIFVLIGVLGDLTASLIKRKSGIKDFSNLIPGHGGILDRFDSNLMIAPVFYQFIILFPLI